MCLYDTHTLSWVKIKRWKKGSFYQINCSFPCMGVVIKSSCFGGEFGKLFFMYSCFQKYSSFFKKICGDSRNLLFFHVYTTSILLTQILENERSTARGEDCRSTRIQWIKFICRKIIKTISSFHGISMLQNYNFSSRFGSLNVFSLVVVRGSN